LAISYALHPALQGGFEPARFDVDVFDCEIEGKVPDELAGTFYRVGGEWLYPPKHPDDSPFAADGYVSMFRIAGGNVDFKGRFVRTPRYLANAQARSQLFGYYRNPFDIDPRARHLNATAANTNIVFHAGKLLALKEDSVPFEIDPDTLETRGAYDFGGKYSSPTFTAHPKVDAATGEMITYGYETEGPATNAIWVYTIDKTGQVTSERRFRAPYLSMVHDIAISENYILFPIYGMTGSLERLKAGKIHWGWDRTLPSHIGVLPRNGDARDVRWFTGPEMAMVHVFSASDRDGRIVLDAIVSDSNPFPFFPSIDGAPFDRERSRMTIRRYTMDMNSKADGWRMEPMFQNMPGGLPRIDDRRQGADFRYGFLGFADVTRPFDEATGGAMKGRVTNCYGRFDLRGNKVDALFAGPTHTLQEVCFAPRSATAAEGDGWVMGVANNLATQKTELVIGDTRDLSAGPIARVRLPFKAAGQIHGNWVPADARGKV
jgi:carotenoid cleavage dioxygenase